MTDRDMPVAMRAYHGDPALKATTLAEMAAHRAADTLVRGVYWQGDRGCAVGCLTRDPWGGHYQYPVRWGIPERLAWLEDAIFERSPRDLAWVWPERFLSAIPVGADLSGVYSAWSATVRWSPLSAGESEHWRWLADALIAAIEAAPVQRRRKVDGQTQRRGDPDGAGRSAGVGEVVPEAARAVAAVRGAGVGRVVQHHQALRGSGWGCDRGDGRPTTALGVNGRASSTPG